VDPRAIEAYAFGTTNLERLSRDGLRTGIDQLETAIAIEPQFAQAWVKLALAHALEGMFGFAKPRDVIEFMNTAASRAVEIDEQFYGGYSALGLASLWTGDIDGACRLFRKALRLNPSAPLAMHGEADCLMFHGHMEESLDRLRELAAMNPFSGFDSFPLAIHLYMARRYDEAIIAARSMQARLPHFPMHRFYSRVYWQQGLFDEALEEERQECNRIGDTVLLAALEAGLDDSGPTGAMRAMAEALAARAAENYVEPFIVGGAYARAGMTDETLYWLEKAVENGSFEMHYIAFWPHLDFLRGDKRYQELADRVYGPMGEDIRKRENISL
jgi:tetratricopeptide (TPR) repeat protein